MATDEAARDFPEQREIMVGGPIPDPAMILIEREVRSVMKERNLKNVPTLDQGSRPIGTRHARGPLEALLAQAEHDEVLPRDYVMCVGYHWIGMTNHRVARPARLRPVDPVLR